MAGPSARQPNARLLHALAVARFRPTCGGAHPPAAITLYQPNAARDDDDAASPPAAAAAATAAAKKRKAEPAGEGRARHPLP
jgi:hypothetical protein